MPFTNQTGDPQKAYVADGLTTSVTSIYRICRAMRDLYVVPAATALTYKDKALTVQQAAQGIWRSLCGDGSVLNSGDKLRISCATDRHAVG